MYLQFRSLSVGGQTMLQLILTPNATVRPVAVSLPPQKLTGSNCGLQNSYCYWSFAQFFLTLQVNPQILPQNLFSCSCTNYPFINISSVYHVPIILLVTWCTNSLTFNICTFCPHCIYVFCIHLRTNSDFCQLQHKVIGFYNRDEKCLLRGTNWVYK